MTTKEHLIKAGFTLNTFPEGKFWEKIIGEIGDDDVVIYQVPEDLSDFRIYEDGYLNNVSWKFFLQKIQEDA